MAVSAWAASTAYSIGDIRRAATAQVTGLFFKVTAVSGSSPYTSGSTEPNWGTDIGSTIEDNEITWTAISSAYEELATLAPSAIIELFELRLNSTLHGSSDIYRWHNGVNAAVDGDITWAGNNYTRQPIEASGFEYQAGEGTLPRPTLTVGNAKRMSSGTYVSVAEITALLLLVNETTVGNDLGGAEVRRIRTLKKFLDGESAADPYAQFPVELWYVDRKASEDQMQVSFELASKFDLPGTTIPKRQVVASVCQWAYRSSECSYTGTDYFDINDNSVSGAANDVCGKRLTSCKKRFSDTLPFGGFPGAGQIK